MPVFVIDAHPLMRDALSRLLRQHWPSLEVHGMGLLAETGDVVERHGPPRLFCLDPKLPDTRGMSGIRHLKRKHPEVPIVVISANPAKETAQACVNSGATLYIEKSASPQDIVATLGPLLQKGHSKAQDGVGSLQLSRRQRQLISLLDQGLSNRDMAEQLGLSEHTIKVHLWRLFRRLEVNSRTQALHQARRHGLLNRR